MKRLSLLLVHAICVWFLAQTVFTIRVLAQDRMASGTWILPPVPIPGHDKGAALWTTLELIQEQQSLTGFQVLSNGHYHNVSRQIIQNGAVTNDSIYFTVRAGTALIADYEGKISGDHIYGTIEIHSTNGGAPIQGKWEATRTIIYVNRQGSSSAATNSSIANTPDIGGVKQSVGSNGGAKP